MDDPRQPADAANPARYLCRPLTLILHDARSFAVTPVYEGDGPLDATPKAVVQDSGYANPSSSAWYVINSLKLITV